MNRFVLCLVVLSFFSGLGHAKRAYRGPSGRTFNIPDLNIDASSLFPSAPGLSALGSETSEETSSTKSNLEEGDGLNLDSIESVGDFSFIEEGEEDLSQLADLMDEESGGTPGYQQKKNSDDFADLMNPSSNVLSSEDPLLIEDSVFGGRHDDPFQTSGDALSSLENF